MEDGVGDYGVADEEVAVMDVAENPPAKSCTSVLPLKRLFSGSTVDVELFAWGCSVRCKMTAITLQLFNLVAAAAQVVHEASVAAAQPHLQ